MSSGVEPPRVSVVVPTFDRPDMLGRALASVFSQTFTQWELILVDDNGVGTEAQRATAAFVATLPAEPRLSYVVHERNKGGGAARNTGIRHARGEFVAFLDDDDAWYPNKVALQVECFERASADVALVYGGFRRHLQTGGTTVVMPTPGGASMTQLLRRNVIGTTSLVMCRRAALEAIGGFDEALRSRQDIDLYVRLAERYPFAFVPELLLDNHQHGGAAIGKNYEATIDAWGRFYAKHKDAFELDPAAHHEFLGRYGRDAVRAGQARLARRLLARAWTLRPARLDHLALAAAAWPWVIRFLRTVRRKGARRRPPAPGAR